MQVLLASLRERDPALPEPTQRFTSWVCIYQTAIIICTNAWVKEWEWDTNAEWIRENEVRIDVTDFMYEKPST